MKNNIGIGITTYNRPEVLKKCVLNIKKYSPKDIKLVIVDDGSKKPSDLATHKLGKNMGIATAKNKCLELLEDCEHIFLFDDDTYPISENWYKPYIESGEPHLMYLFKDFKTQKLNDSELLYQDSKLKALSHPRGCMLYLHNSVLKVAGGMDIEYKKWGFEHCDYSNRIYNLGLTTFRFADIVGSEKLIYSGDEFQEVKTTVDHSERMLYIRAMKEKYEMSFTSKEYKHYKDYKREIKDKKNVIITYFLNGEVDVQRKKVWEADYSILTPLIKSIKAHNQELVIMNNCFNEKDTKNVKHITITQGLNPYFQRYLSTWKYLRDNPNIEFCFMVDGSDVEMLKNPFPEMIENIIYAGDELDNLRNRWLANSTKNSKLQQFFYDNKNKVLLNCGVIGGSRDIMMRMCRDMMDLYFADITTDNIDMAIFNFLIYSKYKDKFEHGRKITSIFKGFEKNSKAWFKHK